MQGWCAGSPNRGTFVTSLSPVELGKYLRLRVVLEEIAALEAARRITNDDLKKLQSGQDAISAAVAKNDAFQAAQADLEFHRHIWVISRDRTLGKLLEQITLPLFAYACMRRSRRHEELRRVVRSHKPIIAALKKGSAEEIRATIRSHIQRSYCVTCGASMSIQERFCSNCGARSYLQFIQVGIPAPAG